MTGTRQAPTELNFRWVYLTFRELRKSSLSTAACFHQVQRRISADGAKYIILFDACQRVVDSSPHSSLFSLLALHPFLRFLTVPFAMRLSAAIAVASLLQTVARTYAFSWLSPDFNESHLKRGLDAIQGDTELVKQIRELYARQQEEVHAWNKAGKPDIAREVLNYRKRSIQKRQNNGTIDAIFGPDDGILVGVANTLVDILEGSKYFPEDNHPFEWPSSTDQRGTSNFYAF